MAQKSLISPTTAAVPSAIFASNFNPGPDGVTIINSSSGVTVAVDTAGGALAGTETITVEYTTDLGGSWKTLVIDGVTQQLSVNNTAMTIFGPLDFRLNKTITAAAVGAVCIY